MIDCRLWAALSGAVRGVGAAHARQAVVRAKVVQPRVVLRGSAGRFPCFQSVGRLGLEITADGDVISRLLSCVDRPLELCAYVFQGSRGLDGRGAAPRRDVRVDDDHLGAVVPYAHARALYPALDERRDFRHLDRVGIPPDEDARVCVAVSGRRRGHAPSLVLAGGEQLLDPFAESARVGRWDVSLL